MEELGEHFYRLDLDVYRKFNINNIVVGDTVKVTGLIEKNGNLYKEHFWVQLIEKLNNGLLVGMVSNNLTNYNIDKSEFIFFEEENIKEHHTISYVNNKADEICEKLKQICLKDEFTVPNIQLKQKTKESVTIGSLIRLQIKDIEKLITILVLFRTKNKEGKIELYGINYDYYKIINESLNNPEIMNKIKQDNDMDLYRFNYDNVVKIIRKEIKYNDNIYGLFI